MEMPAETHAAPPPARRAAALTWIAGGLRLLSRLSPAASSRVAFELFRTPRRFRVPAREEALLGGAEPFEVRLSPSTSVKAWRWGEGPAVLLMHGWEGRGSQLAALAGPIAGAGFSAVTFDAPGHGSSSGRTSSLPHFAWALRGVAAAAGEVRAVVAHSLGCAAATLAIRDGMPVERAVFIAPPLHPSDYTRQFGAMFGLPEKVIDGLRARIEERFLRKWEDYSLAEMAPRMSAALLVVHDRHDAETLWTAGARLAELWPGARLLTTEGLGHRRILRDPAVVQTVADFLKATS
ncbi:MAG TPA: alpha/beta hydrolase [Thermoanaerobaculia bacterium]|nr:alpha/beta hydrolase [Thermoanaerobaculia bacterium]